MTQPADSYVNDDSRADGPANKSVAGGAILADLTSGSAHHKKAVGSAKTENKQVKKSTKNKT
uniref:Uncharacterized protein n=1 Tax=Romanomermis culicivorax TaxID=13658 RepID=A0A915L350_ROMCU